MLKKYSIKSYALIAGLVTALFLPITADADRAADRAMKKDGFGLDSTRGNNSVHKSLRQADGITQPGGNESARQNNTGQTVQENNSGMARDAAPQPHKEGTPTMHDDQNTGMKAPHQSPR